MKPYGEHLEASKHGLRIVLSALLDVAKTLKFANARGILHRDVKPSNIVLYNDHGYLIDWGIASIAQETTYDLSATLLFCSLRVSSFTAGLAHFSVTLQTSFFPSFRRPDLGMHL